MLWIHSTVKGQEVFFKALGFAGKRFLFLPTPLPPIIVFSLSPIFMWPKSKKCLKCVEKPSTETLAMQASYVLINSSDLV